MADDGMLLNFSLDDGIIDVQPKFKGGGWKDRMVAKKIALHHQKKARSDQPTDNHGDSAGNVGGRREPRNANKVEVGARPAKRQRVDGGDFKPSSSRSTAAASGRQESSSRPAAHGQPREIISSLFTYNPTPTSTADGPAQKEEENGEPLKASNAALVDGIDTFTSLGLSPTLAAHLLTRLELKAPTAVQKSAIPKLLKEGSDAFIQAETGSGKTLAYLLPLVQRLMSIPGSEIHRDSGLFAIVLAPTRELCKQISVVLDGLLRCAHWIVAGTVIGGEKKKSEKARLRKGLNVLVATPGRLADHLDNTQVLDVSKVKWLVLDEGDRLMELGFEEELQKIIKRLDERQKPTQISGLPGKRMTILCSATLKMNVQRLGELSLKDATHIQADPSDENGDPTTKTDNQNPVEFSAPAQLRQSYVVVAPKLRLVTLTALLKRTFMRKGSVMKVIVFVSCADSVDFHFDLFTRKPTNENEMTGEQVNQDMTNPASSHGTVAKAAAFSNPSCSVTLHKLHGSLPQQVRTATLSAFSRQKEPSILICTDVASRGLDLPNVDFVIEYDPAFSAEDHLHRIGRTARLGRDGRALIFLQPGPEEGYVSVLKRGYRDGMGKAVSQNDADEILKRGFGGNTDAASKGWEEKATDWQLEIERWAVENPTVLEMARRAYQSHIRAYATHIASERAMFNIKELHLGHLAKSFALRDRPTKINVPGLRPGKEDTKRSFKADRRQAPDEKTEKRKRTSVRDDIPRNADSADAARRMQAKVKAMMGGASEFNIA